MNFSEVPIGSCFTIIIPYPKVLGSICIKIDTGEAKQILFQGMNFSEVPIGICFTIIIPDPKVLGSVYIKTGTGKAKKILFGKKITKGDAIDFNDNTQVQQMEWIETD